MTINDFLEDVRRSGREWRLLDGVAIGDENDHCPIISLASSLGWPEWQEDEEGNIIDRDEDYSVDAAAKHIGLTPRQRRSIMRAADVAQPTRLRKRLLEACGLVVKELGATL